VGFEATEYEFPSGGAPDYDLYTTAAFLHTVVPRTGTDYVFFVRLRHGAADAPRFDATVGATGSAGYENVDTAAAAVEASIHPQAIGWWILAVLAALVGLAVVGQALARQSVVEGEGYPTMAALGLDRRQLVALAILRNLAVGIVGAVGALAVATVLSPIAPLGEARVAESSSGLVFDPLVLVPGTIAVVLIVLALGMWPALRSAQTWRRGNQLLAPQPSSIAAHVAAAGAPPTAVIGIRNALERRASGTPVPVGSALLSTVLAVVALCGTAVFGASLSHLTTTPTLYGDAYQLNFTDPGGGGQPDPSLLRSLEHNQAVTGITEGMAPPEITVNNVAVGVIAGTALRGGLLLSTVTGREPNGPGQIALGAKTMRQADAHVGSIVSVAVSVPTGGKRTVPFRVVAQMSFPVLGGGIVSLGTGAAVTIRGYEAAECAAGPKHALCQRDADQGVSGGGVLVSFVGGEAGQAAINHYLKAYGSDVATGITPTSLINFGEAVNFPLIFGAMLAIFGAATLAHLLVVSVSQRGQDAALLKAVGFTNGQVAATVAWQATTLALIGVLVGVPLGVVAGRAVWSSFATNLGVVPVAIVPNGLIVLLAVGVLLVANLIAVGPAVAAARPHNGIPVRGQPTRLGRMLSA
jgi:putative ABC transport system permease protein